MRPSLISRLFAYYAAAASRCESSAELLTAGSIRVFIFYMQNGIVSLLRIYMTKRKGFDCSTREALISILAIALFNLEQQLN